MPPKWEEQSNALYRAFYAGEDPSMFRRSGLLQDDNRGRMKSKRGLGRTKSIRFSHEERSFGGPKPTASG
jgi:hypothetical protein